MSTHAHTARVKADDHAAARSGKGARPAGGFWVTIKHEDGSWRHVFLQGVRGRESKAQRAANDKAIHGGAGGGLHGEGQVKAHRSGTPASPFRQSPQQRDHASKLDFLSGGQVTGAHKAVKAKAPKAAPKAKTLREKVAGHVGAASSPGKHAAVNAGGERRDGLLTSKHIRAMKAEPMRSTPHGYEIASHTQDAANKAQAARSAKAAELRAQRSQAKTPPRPTLREQAAGSKVSANKVAPGRSTMGRDKAAQAIRAHRAERDTRNRLAHGFNETARERSGPGYVEGHADSLRDRAVEEKVHANREQKKAERIRKGLKEGLPKFAGRPPDAKGQGRLFGDAGRTTAKPAGSTPKTHASPSRPLPAPRRPSTVPARHAATAADVVAHRRLASRLETGRYERKPATPAGQRPPRPEREAALRRRLDERVKAAEKLEAGRKAGGFFKDSALGKVGPEKLAAERARAVADRERAARVLGGKGKAPTPTPPAAPTLRERTRQRLESSKATKTMPATLRQTVAANYRAARGAKPAHAAAKPPAAAHPHEALHKAFHGAPGSDPGSNLVRLDHLRARMGGTREQQDAAIRANIGPGKPYSLESHEGLLRPPDAALKAAVIEGSMRANADTGREKLYYITRRTDVALPHAGATGPPDRTADTMVQAIAMSSPSGRMSKRARAAANEDLRVKLFGKDGLPGPSVKQPTEAESLRQKAAELRGLADRGMKPRAYKAEADRLEAQAASHSPAATPPHAPVTAAAMKPHLESLHNGEIDDRGTNTQVLAKRMGVSEEHLHARLVELSTGPRPAVEFDHMSEDIARITERAGGKVHRDAAGKPVAQFRVMRPKAFHELAAAGR